MRYTVDYGHALVGSVGSRGNGYKEEVENRMIGRLVTDKLRALGHTVREVFNDYAPTLNYDISERVRSIIDFKPDLSISIHLNAFSDPSANGTEVWCKSNSQDVASEIVNALAKIGFRNRGIKDGSNSLGLVSLYGNNTPAVLVECCFITNESDMKLYNTEIIASAIVKGITGVDTTVSLPANPNEEETEKEYSEKGVFTCTVDKIYFRNYPYVGSHNPVQGHYVKGESVNYDYVVITNKYVWISWTSATTGYRRFMPIRERVNGVSKEMWGTIK